MRSGFLLLALVITVSQTRINKKLGNNLLSVLSRSFTDNLDKHEEVSGKKVKDKEDVKMAKVKANVVQRARQFENHLNDAGELVSKFLASKKWNKEAFHMDPVLNVLRRSKPDSRRGRGGDDYDNITDSSSSSQEMRDWKHEWNEQWLQKKLEALNSTRPQGDFVNMVAARPWGVPCGDPNQHDMPWGTCMLAAECDSEYRIYRGDRFCGRTHFVCCALQLSMYDMNQGFDVSLADSSLESDSTEKRNRHQGSREKRRKRRERNRRRRRRDRDIRKRNMKRKIRKIVREVERILNRAYRNGSTIRKKKTKTLKKFLKYLKKKYRMDRDTVKDIHEIQLIRVDYNLMQKLRQISKVNKNFMGNDTFRKIVLEGQMTLNGARMLAEAYPELTSDIRKDKTRRTGTGDPPADYLDYDVEYGMLYY